MLKETRDNAEKSDEGVRQVLRAMDDLTRTITDVSTNTERVASLSLQANNLSRSGVDAAKRADIGMQSITKNHANMLR